MQSIQQDDNLPLFQNGHQFDGHNCGINKLQIMMELEYIKCGIHGCYLTNSGIKYMQKKFNEFLGDLNNAGQENLDFAGWVDTSSLSGAGENMTSLFLKNVLFGDIDNEVDYNNVKFKKNKNIDEPQG
jgi:hypothetical protein